MNGKQLKNSILQWAIQGKLVPQDPNDEPASVLLDKIRQEKERLIKEKKSSVTRTHLLSTVVRTIPIMRRCPTLYSKQHNYGTSEKEIKSTFRKENRTG